MLSPQRPVSARLYVCATTLFVLGLIGMSFVDEKRGLAAARAWHEGRQREASGGAVA